MSPSPFTCFLGRIEHPGLRTVASHWNDVRDDRLMPAWRDIDPTKIARQLGHVWAYSYDRDAESFTGRLAGAEIERVFGKAFRGQPMRALFPDSEFDAMFRIHHRIVAEPCFLYGRGMVFDNLGNVGTGERICLPVADDGAHADGIVGATQYVFGTPNPEPRSEEYFPLR